MMVRGLSGRAVQSAAEPPSRVFPSHGGWFVLLEKPFASG
jgi:hypothetical protein